MPVEHSIWLDLLSPVEHEHLRRSVGELPRRPDVLIVGGGIIGAATAAACHAAGLGSVLLIERSHLAAGATSGSAGMLVPEAHVGVDPPWLVDLMRGSLELWRELDGSRPAGVGLREIPWLVLEPLAANLPTGLLHARRLDAHEVRNLMPRLKQPTGGVLVERQGRVNPVQAVLRLTQDVSVATDVQALDVVCHRDRIRSVRTSRGEIEPGLVVFATGVPPQCAGLHLDVPYGLVKGHLVATEPAPLRVPGYVVGLAMQIDEMRLLVGSSMDPGDESPTVRPEVVEELWAPFVQQLTDTSAVRISHQWCCFRPWHPDSIPVLDRVRGLSNAWFTSGQYKTGVLMAPMTARLLVEWMRTGDRPEAAAGMAAARFAIDSG